MQIEDTYTDDRNVTCDVCEFDGTVDLPLVAYGLIEVAEWVCPDCGAYNDYRNDTGFDRADEYNDRMKEGW